MPTAGEVTARELAEQSLDLLPERSAPGLIDVTVVVPINLALALNAASSGSVASANALQGVGLGH